MIADGVTMPKRATVDSCGYDFTATEDMMCEPGVIYTMGTGVYLEDGDISPRSFMSIHPRSSMRRKCGMMLEGIIDSDYRDEIKLIFWVLDPYMIHKGDRIAQGIVHPYETLAGEDTPDRLREGGVGSTGI